MDDDCNGEHFVSLKPQSIKDSYLGIIFIMFFKFSSTDVCSVPHLVNLGSVMLSFCISLRQPSELDGISRYIYIVDRLFSPMQEPSK
jgi:hypothetical protein